MKDDISGKFWEKYLKSDCIERLKLVESIAAPLMKTAQAKISVQSFAVLLNSYFEDLAEFCRRSWR